MKQTMIYPTTTGDRTTIRGGYEKTKTLICGMQFGSRADKACVLKLFEI